MSIIVDELARRIPELLRREVGQGSRYGALLGPVWERVVETLEADPARFEAAGEPELAQLVQAAVAAPDPEQRLLGTRSGALESFIDPQLRDRSELPPGEASQNKGLEDNPLVAAALALADSEGNATLERNLKWMIERDEGYAYEAIAKQSGSPAASVRTGVRRARQAIRRIAQAQRRAAHAPHQGVCPAALEPAREAWKNGDLDSFEALLTRVSRELGRHPYFWFLSGLLADDRGEPEEARALFERVLLHDDDPALRAKVLNCLGYMADDRARLEEAHELWSRSVRVDPSHTPAHVNLLKNACDRRDKLDVHVAIDMIGALLTSRSLSRPDKEYLVNRLKEHPDFSWARSFDAWRKGPARWIARYESSGRATAQGSPRRRVAASIALGIALALAIAGVALDFEPLRSAPVDAGLELAGSGDRGGLTGTRRVLS